MPTRADCRVRLKGLSNKYGYETVIEPLVGARADARGVVSGVRHDHDPRIARFPLSGVNQLADHVVELGGGDGDEVGAGLQSNGVQNRRPGGVAGLPRGDERLRPAGGHLVLGVAATGGVAERAVRAGPGVRAGPTARYFARRATARRRAKAYFPGPAGSR